jgi:hypothetical protein
MSAPKLTDYDRDILRMLSGEKVEGLAWGAAMGAAIGFLRGDGYVRQVRNAAGIGYEITDSGRAALAEGDEG